MKVFKPTYSKPLPEGAKILVRNGKQFARFKDTKGQIDQARLTKKGDGILVETAHWHIGFEDNLGIRRAIRGFTDRQATQRLADRIQDLLNYKANNAPLTNELQKFIEQLSCATRDELIEFGVLNAEHATAGKSLDEYIDVFRQFLILKERDPKHIEDTVSSIKRVFEACGFNRWRDISADKLKNHLDEKRDSGKGISKRTYNGYLKTAKYFCKWLAKQLHTTSPIEYIEGLENEGTDQRHPRRAISTDEVCRLLETTAAGPERWGMSGYERALVYRFAAETGLRANEIRTLTTGKFDFDNLTVTVKSSYSKHRREDIQAFLPELAALLKEHCRGKLPAAKVFGGSYSQLTDKTADMLKLDLADAGIPYILDGNYFDFHALRHQFGTSLKNVSSRIAQGLLRHKSSAMTDRYTHPELHDERAALNALPDYGKPSSQKQQAVKTGTDERDVTGEILSKSWNQNGQQRIMAVDSGERNADCAQKTALRPQNEGAEHTLNQRVAGSIPASPIGTDFSRPQRSRRTQRNQYLVERNCGLLKKSIWSAKIGR